MAKPSVLQMLQKPMNQKTASSVTSLESAAELISQFHALLGEKDAQIASMQRTIDHLTRQATGAREKPQMPELHFEITGRDMNGHIKTLSAKPRQ